MLDGRFDNSVCIIGDAFLEVDNALLGVLYVCVLLESVAWSVRFVGEMNADVPIIEGNGHLQKLGRRSHTLCQIRASLSVLSVYFFSLLSMLESDSVKEGSRHETHTG